MQTETPAITREQLFAEVKQLELKAAELIPYDDRQDEFDVVMDRTAELVGIARSKGWIA